MGSGSSCCCGDSTRGNPNGARIRPGEKVPEPASIADKNDLKKVPLVFIGGIKGSHLMTKSGKRKYLTGCQGLGVTTYPLALPLTWRRSPEAKPVRMTKRCHELNADCAAEAAGFEQDFDDLEEGGVLEKVSLGCLSVSVYGKFTEWARKQGRPFYSFGYDWRRDNNETVDALSDFLAEVYVRHGQIPVQIVAHSMGGLLVHAALGARPLNEIHSVLYAGTAFRSGVGFLDDLHIGQANAIGLNNSILSPAVMMTFPSSFTFFPADEEEQIRDHAYIVSPMGERVPLDFYNPADWKRHKMGLYSTDLSKEQIKVLDNHMVHALAVARKFRGLLRPQMLLGGSESLNRPKNLEELKRRFREQREEREKKEERSEYGSSSDSDAEREEEEERAARKRAADEAKEAREEDEEKGAAAAPGAAMVKRITKKGRQIVRRESVVHPHPMVGMFYTANGNPLEKNLTEADKELRDTLDVLHPPMITLAGVSVPTPSTIIKGGPKSVRGYDVESAPKEPGDGRVRFSQSPPPNGVQHKFREARKYPEHTELLNDTELVGKLLRELHHDALCSERHELLQFYVPAAAVPALERVASMSSSAGGGSDSEKDGELSAQPEEPSDAGEASEQQ